MEKLNTIQKRAKLNDVYPKGELGPGGAYHDYMVVKEGSYLADAGVLVGGVLFQKGPRHDVNSVHGIIDTDLLEIVRHRLQCFQQGPFASRENACALTHIEEALMWMNRRVEDRLEREVLGTYNK